MKKILLTIDYELHLGAKTGTVRDCMVEPTEKLTSILEKNDSKMTVFWDILHYYRLLEFENKYTELKQDRQLIEKQILDLAENGHDIQLHLHPHWLDAEYKDCQWSFKYNRFKLHNLLDENKPDDINTVMGCVSISKKIMENLIKKVDPDYKITTFRAGGYLLEPFAKIRDALLKNEITIDSSVCPGLYENNKISPFNFRFYPNKSIYNFDLTPKMVVDEGDFIEIPIATIKLSKSKTIYFKLLRLIKYPSLEDERTGLGVSDFNATIQKTKIYNFISILFSQQFSQFTTDSNFHERFDYLYQKLPEYSTMILHPKLLNSHTLGILDEYLTKNKMQFITIREFLN